MAQAEDNLQAALALFNEGMKVQQDAERAQRAIDKADRRKQQAANTLKKVQGNTDASGEEKAEAETAYRAAVNDLNRLRSGEEPLPADEDAADAAAVEPDAPDTTGDAADAAPAHEDAPDTAGDTADEDAPDTTGDTADEATVEPDSADETPADGPATEQDNSASNA